MKEYKDLMEKIGQEVKYLEDKINVEESKPTKDPLRLLVLQNQYFNILEQEKGLETRIKALVEHHLVYPQSKNKIVPPNA